jgi:hypothetical protein
MQWATQGARTGAVFAALAAGIVCAAEPVSAPEAVPVELWDRPRSGRSLLAVPAIHKTLAALAASPGARLRIRHPAAVEGTLQAEELRTWLIAHAIDPARVTLLAEPAARQPLQLEILP